MNTRTGETTNQRSSTKVTKRPASDDLFVGMQARKYVCVWGLYYENVPWPIIYQLECRR